MVVNLIFSRVVTWSVLTLSVSLSLCLCLCLSLCGVCMVEEHCLWTHEGKLQVKCSISFHIVAVRWSLTEPGANVVAYKHQ